MIFLSFYTVVCCTLSLFASVPTTFLLPLIAKYVFIFHVSLISQYHEACGVSLSFYNVVINEITLSAHGSRIIFYKFDSEILVWQLLAYRPLMFATWQKRQFPFTHPIEIFKFPGVLSPFPPGLRFGFVAVGHSPSSNPAQPGMRNAESYSR